MALGGNGEVPANASGAILQRIATLFPFAEAAQKWPDARDSHAPQFERHTGTRGFVGSGAVQDDFAVARQLALPRRQFVWRHASCAGNYARVGKHVEGMPQVNDVGLLPLLNEAANLIRRDARCPQVVAQAPPLLKT